MLHNLYFSKRRVIIKILTSLIIYCNKLPKRRILAISTGMADARADAPNIPTSVLGETFIFLYLNSTKEHDPITATPAAAAITLRVCMLSPENFTFFLFVQFITYHYI